MNDWTKAQEAADRARALRQEIDAKEQEAKDKFDDAMKGVGEPGVPEDPSPAQGGGDEEQTAEAEPNDCFQATHDFWACQIAQWLRQECADKAAEIDDCPLGPLIYTEADTCGSTQQPVSPADLERVLQLACDASHILPGPEAEDPCRIQTPPANEDPERPGVLPTCEYGLSCPEQMITVVQSVDLCSQTEVPWVAPAGCAPQSERTTKDFRLISRYFIPSDALPDVRWDHSILVLEYSAFEESLAS